MHDLLKSYFKNFVQLRQRDIDCIYPKVKDLIESLLEECNRNDDSISKTPIFVRSYWQGLKVDKPDEYDVCVQLNTGGLNLGCQLEKLAYRLRLKETGQILWKDKVLNEDGDKYELFNI